MSTPSFKRTDRLAAVIQCSLDRIIRRKLKEPSLAFGHISLTAVKVSRDLSYAKVYVSMLARPEGYTLDQKTQVMAALKRAAPYLRHLLKLELASYKIPELRFIYDDWQDEVYQLDQRLQSI